MVRLVRKQREHGDKRVGGGGWDEGVFVAGGERPAEATS